MKSTRAKGEKYIDAYAKSSVLDHNKVVKEAEKVRLDAVADSADTFAVQYGLLAREGKLSQTAAMQEFNRLLTDPNIKGDPQAEKRVYVAFDKVSNEIAQQERHADRMRSEAKTRQAITQSRLDNDINVSSGALDQLWQKNGMIKGFFNNNNVLPQGHIQEIDKAGAVPTTILASIQNDFRSQDPSAQRRGVNNLLAIKNFSSKAQQALYKDLPQDFAGVIQRVENGQTPTEALAFLSRPRNTPDVEKKLHVEADTKPNRAVADGALSDAGFKPTNMSSSMRDEAQVMWQDAFSRSSGDPKLAKDLFRQDLSKNRKWGESAFSGKIEKYPATKFATKDQVTEMINTDFPETKGKDVLPVFGGMKTTPDGKQIPTYDIYMKDDSGIMKKVNEQKPFYMTDEAVAAIAERTQNKQLDKALPANEEIKANQRYWENKKPDPKMVAPKKADIKVNAPSWSLSQMRDEAAANRQKIREAQ